MLSLIFRIVFPNQNLFSPRCSTFPRIFEKRSRMKRKKKSTYVGKGLTFSAFLLFPWIFPYFIPFFRPRESQSDKKLEVPNWEA